MVVTPLRDGMNLVAKEYVAARADTGRRARAVASSPARPRELRQAFMCNPHDIDSIKDALMRGGRGRPDRGRAGGCSAMRRYLRDARRAASGPSDFLTALAACPEAGAPRRATWSSSMTTMLPPVADRRPRRARARHAVGRIARVPQLLVACDYDGTLAPIVDDPTPGACRCRRRSPRSAPSPRCRRPRSRSSPGGRCATWPRCPGCPARSTSSAATAPSSTSASSSASRPSWSSCAPGCGRRAARARPRARRGVRLEQKPASVAVHTRGADRDVAAEVLEAVRVRPGHLARTCT